MRRTEEGKREETFKFSGRAAAAARGNEFLSAGKIFREKKGRETKIKVAG